MPVWNKTQQEAKKHGLRKKQVEILKVLAEAKGPLNKSTICERSHSHPTTVWANCMGNIDDESRGERENKNGYLSLLTLGLVVAQEFQVEEGLEETIYKITPQGRKALEEHLKAH